MFNECMTFLQEIEKVNILPKWNINMIIINPKCMDEKCNSAYYI